MPRHPGAGDAVASQAVPHFEPCRAFELARRLAFPRRAGTLGERRAAGLVVRAFEDAGLAVRRESFAVPFLERGLATRAVFLLAASLAVIGLRLSSRGEPLPAACCWGAIALLVPTPWRLSHRIGASGWTRLRSRNIVAALPFDGSAEAPARVIFVAHHDSKSQPLPTGVRVGVVVTAVVAATLLTVWGCLAVPDWVAPPNGRLAWGLVSLVLAALTALAFNLTGNASSGALDNASGVGVLLELARIWRPRPGSPVEPLWISTGAEETGLDGARAFVERHRAWLQRRPTLVVNLDSVGTGDWIYLDGSTTGLAIAQPSAEALGLAWRRLRIVGAGMDHQPFADAGIAAVSLLGDVVGHSLAMHSPRDGLHMVEPEALERAGRLAAEIAWAWADQHVLATGPGERVLETTGVV